MIYPHDGPYEEKEEEKYEELLDFVEGKDEKLPEVMTKRRAMRFLVTNNFKVKKAYENIKSHLKWRANIHPIILNETHMRMLDAGYMYIHGRDKCLRPICLSNMGVINDLDVDMMEGVAVNWFMCFYMIDNLMTIGKVENWILVVDMNGLSLSKLPTKTLKAIMNEAQEHLKCRVRMFYYFNVTFGLRAIWTMVSPFVDKVIKHKIIMKADGNDPSLLDLAHPSQIEQKYGGEAEDVTEFWPPYCPSEEYGVQEQSLSD